MSDTIRVQLNGKPKNLPGGITVQELLSSFSLGSERVAVAVNGEVSPRSERARRRIQDGDVIEVIQAVAGG